MADQDMSGMGTTQSQESRLDPPINWEQRVARFETGELSRLCNEALFNDWYLKQIRDHRVIGTVGEDANRAQHAIVDEYNRRVIERSSDNAGK